MNFNYRTIRILVLMISFLACFVLIPFDAHAESQIIRNIEFVGFRHIPVSDIQASFNFVSKIGQPFHSNDVILDANNLYLTGYFSQVEPTILSESNGVTLRFSVTENPVIEKISFQHLTVFSEQTLKFLLKSKEGELLNLNTIQADKAVIEAFYHQKGYDLCKVTSIQEVRVPTADALVSSFIFDLNECVIDDISFEGLDQLPSMLFIREMNQQKGKVFNANELKQDRLNLLNLGYLSDISTPILSAGAESDKVNIKFIVKEKKSNLLNYGLETESDYWVGFLQGNIHHLGLWGSLLTSKVQLYIQNQKLSYKSYSLRYTQPWVVSTMPLSASLGHWNEVDATEKHKYGADFRLEYPLMNRLLTFSTVFKRERIRPLSSSSYQILSVALGLNYYSCDSLYNPTYGTYWFLEYEYGDPFGFSSVDILRFSRYSINWATFLAMSPSDILGLHFFGGIFLLKDQTQQITELPGFTIGGANSIRGYHEDITIEKPKKLLANLELRHLFSPDIQGVLFLDVGRLFDEDERLDFSQFKCGYGTGLRFFTPVGPIRLDFAFSENQNILVHVNLGQVF